MAQASVSISFQAVDEADVEAKMANWVLHEGCTVNVTMLPDSVVLETDSEGSLQPVPPPELLSE